MENKVLTIKLDGEYFVVAVDPNKDGEPVMELKIHLSEIPDEVISALKAK